jgi:hypothetical protein
MHDETSKRTILLLAICRHRPLRLDCFEQQHASFQRMRWASQLLHCNCYAINSVLYASTYVSTPLIDQKTADTSCMDPERALQLARGGCFIVCTDVPARTSIGLDNTCFLTADRFLGFKMVPEGFHLLHWASADDRPRSSVMLHLAPQSCTVLAWDRATESLQLRDEDSDAARALAAAARRMELDDRLGAYGSGDTVKPHTAAPAPASSSASASNASGSSGVSFGSHGAWLALTNCIAPSVVDRVQPVGRVIEPDAVAPWPLLRALDAAADATAADADASSSAPAAGRVIFFSPLRGVGPGSEPSDRTQYAMDTTSALEAVALHIERQQRELPKSSSSSSAQPSAPVPPAATVQRHILGELQLAYVLCLFGQHHVALEQWKHLVDIICRCEDGLLRSMSAADAGNGSNVHPQRDTWRTYFTPQFFAEAYAVIAAQLRDLSPDILDGSGMAGASGGEPSAASASSPSTSSSSSSSSSSFLRVALVPLLRTLQSAVPGSYASDPKLRASAIRLMSSVRDRFGSGQGQGHGQGQGRRGLQFEGLDGLAVHLQPAAAAAAIAAKPEGYRTMEELMRALRLESGGGGGSGGEDEDGDEDLPVVVTDEDAQ